MSVEVVSVGKFQQSVLFLLETLLDQGASPGQGGSAMQQEAGGPVGESEASQADEKEGQVASPGQGGSATQQEFVEYAENLKEELKTLQKTAGNGVRGEEQLASLITRIVDATLNGTVEYTFADETDHLFSESYVEGPSSVVSLSSFRTYAGFHPEGWDGRSWQPIASKSTTPTSNSFLEFKTIGKESFIDLLEDAIKAGSTDTLMQGIAEKGGGALLSVLGPKTFAALGNMKCISIVLGIVLLFCIRYSQSNAVTVPRDCACIWGIAHRVCITKGYVTPSAIDGTFVQMGNSYTSEDFFVPCDSRKKKSSPDCPFRAKRDEKTYCTMVHENGPSFRNEKRIDKIIRALNKLIRLGLLETQIDKEPSVYLIN